MLFRTISAKEIEEAVAMLCIQANRVLPKSLESCMKKAALKEESELGKAVMGDLCKNLEAAREMELPICQDTGMAVVFAQVGQELHIDGDFEAAVNAGVAKGYTQGLLRCSVVADPLNRVNTGDNTPAIIHTKLVPGNRLRLMVAPKGFGSENMSAIRMFAPSAVREDIINFVCNTVRVAGGNPCPPLVLGVGIGGDFELAAILAKQALCRDIEERNKKIFYAELEKDILNAVNATGIGPQGFGGTVSALCVNIEEYPTHIAGLPVAVNVGCHVTRHKQIII